MNGQTRALALTVALILDSAASAQTTLNAAAAGLRSTGTAAGTDVTLTSNGFLGTYITLATPGEVRFTVNAAGVADGGAAPRMNLVVDDYKSSFHVAAGANAYNGTVSLPAGTHLVRLEYDNDVPTAANRALTLKNLSVTGATIVNPLDSQLPAANALALAAANTYINNYRKGNARNALTGPGDVPLLEGTPVRAKLARNAFNFGGTVSGSTLNDQKDMLGVTNPAAGTQQRLFQDFVKKNFNMIVGSNSGKWSNNESAPGTVDMRLPDRQLDWAIANNKRARMHNVIWGDGVTSGKQQPAYVNALIASAAAGDANAKTQLRAAISNRIQYFAGANGKRSLKYTEIDGLNESLHNPSYMNIFGDAGMTDIYQELSAALKAVGSPAKTYLNEFNVLQYSPASINPATGVSTGSDPYANYYRQHIDSLRAAGTDLGGIGIQYYANYTQTGSNAHGAHTIQKALSTLSVAGLPLSLTEFGGTSSMGLAQNAAGVQVLDDAMRMVFGNAQADTFLIWGWWDLPTNPTPPAALLDNTNGNLTLTQMGVKWQQLMAEFSTDVVGSVGADGKLAFNGFYGDYNIGNQAGFSNLTFNKGTGDYSLKLTAPPSWSLFSPTAANTLWASASNWTGGTPGGVGTTAHFLPTTAARSITLSSATTVGQVNFEGLGKQTIAGNGALRLEVSSGKAALNVVSGSHEIAVPVTLDSDARAVVRDASSTLTLRALADAPQRSLGKAGLGTLAVDHVRLRGLTISEGTVAMLPGGSTNVVNTLSLAASATLDIGNSTWAIDYDASAGSPAAAIRAAILTGRGIAGGIRSSSLSSQQAIGYAEATAVPDSGFDATTVMFRATYGGDSNLDGVVNFADLVALAQHYGDATQTRSWSEGDSNYDGVVDFKDLVVLAQNYGAGASATGAPAESFSADWARAQTLVPTPGALATLSLGAFSARAARR